MAKRKYTRKPPEITKQSEDMEQTFSPDASLEAPQTAPPKKKKSQFVMKICLVHPDKFYLDPYTHESYIGEGEHEVKKSSHYIITNTASTKKEALLKKKPFYKVM